MPANKRLAELSLFLKAKRGAISPKSVGLSSVGRRLQPGLRREEVATLANVGFTWYSWLEQGRDIRPSRNTLESIAKALLLGSTDTAYLLRLADGAEGAPEHSTYVLPPALASVLESFQGPAVILDPLFDVLAYNTIADMLYDFERGVEPYPDNQLWQLFRQPGRRELYVDAADDVRNFVELFRLTSVSRINTPRHQRLLESLLQVDEFAASWNSRRTAPVGPRVVRMRSPVLGDLAVQAARLSLDDSDGAMLVLLAPADRATAVAFAQATRVRRDEGGGDMDSTYSE